MSATVTALVSIETTTCATCGVEFGMPSPLLRARREGRASIYCPSGHRGIFDGPTEAEILREQLKRRDAELARAAEREDGLRRQRQTLEHRLYGTQGALTKVKKRVGNGVCPCCDRSFVKLAAHMKTKHPDFGGKEKP